MSKKTTFVQNYLQLNKKKYANSCPGNTTVYTERTREVYKWVHWFWSLLK